LKFIGVMGIGAVNAAHFMQDNGDAGSGAGPGSFGPGKAAADDVDRVVHPVPMTAPDSACNARAGNRHRCGVMQYQAAVAVFSSGAFAQARASSISSSRKTLMAAGYKGASNRTIGPIQPLSETIAARRRNLRW
jgi:hypothetical protein